MTAQRAVHRLMSEVDRNDCIDHGQQGCRGYGRKLFEGKVRVYHRVAYCKHHGISHTEIVGLVVRHRCDNPRCINPEHLEIGTQLDNVRDCIERGRERKPKGMRHRDAKLTDDIVRQIRAEYKKRSKTHGNEALARKYGVCTDTIYLCVARKTWRHI